MARINPRPFGEALKSYGLELIRHVPEITDVDDWVQTICWLSETHIAVRASSRFEDILTYQLRLERASRGAEPFNTHVTKVHRTKLLEQRGYAAHYLAVQRVFDRYLHFHAEDYACPEHEGEKIRAIQEQLHCTAHH